MADAAPKFRLNAYGYLLRQSWKHAGRMRLQIIALHILHTLAVTAGLAGPFIMGELITTLQRGGPHTAQSAVLWLALWFGSSVGFWMFHGPARLLEQHLAFENHRNGVADLYKKITEMPFVWHQDHHSGDTINRVNTAALALRNFAEGQYLFIQSIGRLIISGAMLFWLSPFVGLVSLGTLAVIFIIITVMDRRLHGFYHAYNERSHALGALFFDYVSNMVTLLTLRLAHLSRTSLGQAFLRMRAPHVKSADWNEAKWFSLDVLLALVSAGTLILYILWELKSAAATGGTIALGAIVAIQQYQNQLGGVLRTGAMKLGDLMRWQTNWAAVENLLADHATLGVEHRALDAGDAAHPSLELTDLRLTRRREGGAAFTLDVPRLALTGGEKIALIGESGGGKSTLLYLLRGIYAPDRGALRVARAPRPLVELHDVTSLIPQDPEIFENTIRFNITLGLDAADSEIMEMVRLAGFDGVLTGLPRGLQTDIREKGVNLSVGQKQRLALARGLFAAARSSIVLMDEPTSSLDLATEQKILLGLFQAFRRKTMVVSLHRLHLLPHFDRVLCMKDGELIADGPVREMLTRPGAVREVYQRYVVTERDGEERAFA
jgi:ABC-type multidrug transport system fused ATPase/permease subunit